MARQWIELLHATLVVVCLTRLAPWFVIMVLGNNNNLLYHIPSHQGSRPAMILPLYLSSANSSRTASSARRHIQNFDSKQHPNARMRLYDDLLRNGYYTARLLIGTPPQTFALIVDTGSTVTYVPCATCEQCGKHQAYVICGINSLVFKDPKFQSELSSTYQPVKCSLDCICDSEKNQCVYERQYAEMSSSRGVLSDDVISFGNLSDLQPQRAVFGCENVETGDLYRQRADGIMGLGRGDLSIVDQLVKKSVISDSFSLCYGGMDIGGGAMVLGAISPPSDMVFAYSDPVRSPYYNIDLKELHVAGKQLHLNPRVFDGKHGTVLDSGTTYSYLPEAVFVVFKKAITKELYHFKQIPGPDPNYHDICFFRSGMDVSRLSKFFPVVDMVFGNGQKLSLSPENYLFQHSKKHGAYCLGIFQNGKDRTTLLGGIIVRNTLVVYDREHTRIGFWKTNCSELWERLGLSDVSPPLPLNSSINYSNGTLAPSLSPVTPPDLLPGELQIAQITITIFFNVSYSVIKPHVAELAKFIAQEIDVDTSQVHFLNFSSNGKGSLFKWAIIPVVWNDYMSNATAMSMVSRLEKHQMQLPITFGNYKLVDWNVEPPSKRTWWQQHHLVVALIVLVALLVGLSIGGIFFMWKQRQWTASAYKPIHLSVPEHELQPLSNT